MKSGLRQAGEILVLVGAILSTIGQAAFILVTFLFWSIPGAIIISFTWVTRYKVISSNSRNWNIFGIVLGALTDWVGLAGYICLLIDDIQNEQKLQTTTVVENQATEQPATEQPATEVTE